MWGSFWLAQGILFYLNVRLLSRHRLRTRFHPSSTRRSTRRREADLVVVGNVQAAGTVPPSSIHEHFPELAAWFIPLAAFTWSGVRFPAALSPPNPLPRLTRATESPLAGHRRARPGRDPFLLPLLLGDRIHDCLLSLRLWRRRRTRDQSCGLLLDAVLTLRVRLRSLHTAPAHGPRLSAAETPFPSAGGGASPSTSSRKPSVQRAKSRSSCPCSGPSTSSRSRSSFPASANRACVSATFFFVCSSSARLMGFFGAPPAGQARHARRRLNPNTAAQSCPAAPKGNHPARPVLYISLPGPAPKILGNQSCPASRGAAQSLSSVSPDRALASACFDQLYIFRGALSVLVAINISIRPCATLLVNSRDF